MTAAAKARALLLGPWPYLLLLLIPPISFARHFAGRMVLGWDAQPPMRPDLLLGASLSAWRWTVDLGQPSVFVTFTQTPLALVYQALTAPFGIELAEKTLIAALFALPAFTMYYCARRMWPHDAVVPALAGWCYALCPLAFVRLYVPIVQVELAYALLPLLVNVWIGVVRSRARPRNLLLLALVQFALLPAGANLAYWLVPQLTAGALALLVVAMEPRARRARLRAIALAIAVVALVNAFWLVPQVLFGVVEGATYESEALNANYTAGIRKEVAENSALSYTMRFASRSQITARDKNGPYWTYADALAKGAVAAPFFAWIFFCGVALAAFGRDRRVIGLGVLLCGALFAMKGEAPPFAALLDVGLRLPLVGTLFRDSYDKLLPTAAFASSLLVPLGFDAVRRALRAPALVSVALVAAVVAMAFPGWSGQMFMARAAGPTLSSMPPRDAWRFARALDRVSSRVLFLPASQNPELFAMRWPYYGVNVYVNMTSASVVASPEGRTNSPEVDAVTSGIYDAVLSGDAARFVALTRNASVGYVFVAHDVNTDYYGGETPAQADEFLARLGNTRIEEKIGPYSLWHLLWVPPLERAIVARPIVASAAPKLTQALLLTSRCGSANYAILDHDDVPDSKAECTVSQSPFSSSNATVPAARPMRARVESGRMLFATSRGGGVALPPHSAFARVDYHVIGAAPAALPLVPRAAYRYEAFAQTGRVRQLHVPAVASGGLFLPLQGLDVGWQRIDVDTRRAAGSVHAIVTDKDTGVAVAIQNGLEWPRTSFLTYAMPGRRYELDVDGPLPDAASYVAGVSTTAARRTAAGTFVSPDVTGAVKLCPIPPSGIPYVVLDDPLLASVALDGAGVLARMYGVAPPGDVVTAPLPAGTDALAAGDGVLTAGTIDRPAFAGTPLLERGYRQTGPSRPIRLRAAVTSGARIGVTIDRQHAGMVLQAGAPDQFAYVTLAPMPLGDYAVTIDASPSAAGTAFGGAVVDGITSLPLAGTRSVTTATLTLTFHAQARHPYNLFFYTDAPANDGLATLRIARVTIAPVAASGFAAITVPAVAPGLDTDQHAMLVRRFAPSGWSALVLDTQFDRFWVTALVRPAFPWISFPRHVLADGYKNGWIVPSGATGRPVDFYALTWLGYAGLPVCALTIAVLAWQARRRRRRIA